MSFDLHYWQGWSYWFYLADRGLTAATAEGYYLLLLRLQLILCGVMAGRSF